MTVLQFIRNLSSLFRSLLDSVFAVSVFADKCWNVSTANNEVRLYLISSGVNFINVFVKADHNMMEKLTHKFLDSVLPQHKQTTLD